MFVRSVLRFFSLSNNKNVAQVLLSLLCACFSFCSVNIRWDRDEMERDRADRRWDARARILCKIYVSTCILYAELDIFIIAMYESNEQIHGKQMKMQ